MNNKATNILLDAGYFAYKATLDCPAAYEGVFLGKYTELLIRQCAEIALREDHDPHSCILTYFGITDD